MVRARTLAALTLALVLAACGRPPAPEASTPAPGQLEDAAPSGPPSPGNGYLKLRKIYDYVGDRAGTEWAPFELNGDYNYPEPIFGGWPIRVTPVDAAGNSTGAALDTASLQELSPTDGRYLELPAGRYRVEELVPTATAGGGVWSQTGANLTQGGVTTSAGGASAVTVEVVAGTTAETATVARFFNVCRIGGAVQTFPSDPLTLADITRSAWACRPSFKDPDGSTGSLDPTFGNGGRVTTRREGYDFATGVAIQPDGKIVVSQNTDIPGPDGTFTIAAAVVRYNPDGSVDSSFGSGSRALFDLRLFSTFGGLAVQADGRIVVAGQNSSSNFAVARLLPDGSLDLSFDGDGYVSTDICFGDDFVLDLTIQADGKIVVVGEAPFRASSCGSVPGHVAVVRYNPDGSLDTSFGGDGRVTPDFGPRADTGSDAAVTVQEDGKIVLSSYSIVLGNPLLTLARLNPDGSLDPSFGSGGVVVANLSNFGGNDLALQSDGKIVVLNRTFTFATSGSYVAVLRYLPNGAPDPSFGSGGLALPNPGSNQNPAGMVIQGDGKIVIGASSGGGEPQFTVVRLESDGSPDLGFANGGRLFTGLAGQGGDVALQGDGRIVGVTNVKSDGVDNFDVALVRVLP